MLTSGSITCRVYRLAEKPPPDFLDKADRDLKRHAFREVDVAKSPRSMGWVRAQDILNTDVRVANSMYEDFLVLGLRVDKVAVNARLLKAYFQRAADERLQETGRSSLSRDERAALLEKTKLQMLTMQTPATALYEVAWNTADHLVYFSATSEALNQEFADLFQDTFHVGLLPQLPYLRAEAYAEPRGLGGRLGAIEPEIFSPIVRMQYEIADQ